MARQNSVKNQIYSVEAVSTEAVPTVGIRLEQVAYERYHVEVAWLIISKQRGEKPSLITNRSICFELS